MAGATSTRLRTTCSFASKESLASKGAPFTLTPDAGDGFVYQDEFVNWVDHEFPGSAGSAHPIFFSLEQRARPLAGDAPAQSIPMRPTYAELAAKSIAHATGDQEREPGCARLRPGETTLVRLRGAAGRARRRGPRLPGVLARRDRGPRNNSTARAWSTCSTCTVPRSAGRRPCASREPRRRRPSSPRAWQAPRSLWDPSYTETSWIAQDSVGGPIALLPRLRDKIDANAPGTKLAVTEYNYGGGQHISGGIAQADVLGVFGREGVFAASEWPLAGDESYIKGAFEMYRNFDGANGRFGDTSVRAGTDDIAGTSIYASVNSSDPERIVVVALNKTAAPIDASIDLANPTPLLGAKVYRLVSTSPSPVAAGDLVPAGGSHLAYTMPAYSVNTLVLAVPEADPAGAAVAIASCCCCGYAGTTERMRAAMLRPMRLVTL